MSRRWASVLLLALAAAACGQKDTTPKGGAADPDAAASSTRPADAAVSTGPVVDEAGTIVFAWPDAIRAGRWTEAAEGLAKLSTGEQNKPEVKLARARVAIAQKKHAEAIQLLEGLDDALPLLRDLIAKTRALAMFEVGPYDKAGMWFDGRRETSSLVHAGEAWEKAGDATKAKVAWDRVIAAEKRSRAQEENARTHRMQIVRLKDGDPAAQADARWLTIHALDDKAFRDAADLLEKLTPPKLLTSDELLTRAKALADAGRSEEALRAIERAQTRGSITAIDLCRAKSEVFWKSHRYSDSAIAYRSCAAMGGAHAPEDLLLAARSFSRAAREVDALPVFQLLITKHPKTVQAEQAEFHLAREHVLQGRYKDGTFAFDEWVKKYPGGKDRREAERYRALAHLLARNDKKARKLLEDLSGGAEDPIAAARWTNLAALAALRDGDKLHALARWADVVRTKPLSYPALIARARITENGGTPPAWIDPAESGSADPITVELPQPADMLHRIGFDAEAEEALREREAAVVQKVPQRGTEALCAAYALVDRAKRRYQVALQIPLAQVQTAPGPKNRGAWECLFPRPHDGLVRISAGGAKITPELVWSVMRQESSFDPEVVSPAHAFGLMQLLPETARTVAKAKSITHDDSMLTSPAQNILLGSHYLRDTLDAFEDNTALAVAAYNGGPEAIRRWLVKMKGTSLDVFVEAIPFVETRGYVSRVMGNLARYAYLDRGETGVPTLSLDLPTKKAVSE